MNFKCHFLHFFVSKCSDRKREKWNLIFQQVTCGCRVDFTNRAILLVPEFKDLGSLVGLNRFAKYALPIEGVLRLKIFPGIKFSMDYFKCYQKRSKPNNIFLLSNQF